jgi:hypothetical protein
MACMNGTQNEGTDISHFSRSHPRLRAPDATDRPDGQPYILLRDPRQLNEHQLLVPSR